MVYCLNKDCPFRDCENHVSKCKVGFTYTFVDFAGVCRRYITYRVEEVTKMKDKQCKDCKWLDMSREKTVIGYPCTNFNRKRYGKYKRDVIRTSDMKFPTNKACKTGFEPREEKNCSTCIENEESVCIYDCSKHSHWKGCPNKHNCCPTGCELFRHDCKFGMTKYVGCQG